MKIWVTRSQEVRCCHNTRDARRFGGSELTAEVLSSVSYAGGRGRRWMCQYDSGHKIIHQPLVATGAVDAPVTTNQEVAGSSPAGRAKFHKDLRVHWRRSPRRCAQFCAHLLRLTL